VGAVVTPPILPPIFRALAHKVFGNSPKRVGKNTKKNCLRIPPRGSPLGNLGNHPKLLLAEPHSWGFKKCVVPKCLNGLTKGFESIEDN